MRRLHGQHIWKRHLKINQRSWSTYTCETVCSPVDPPDNGQPSFIQPLLQRCLGGSGLRTIIMDKSLGTLLHFLGVFQFTQAQPLRSSHKTMLDECIQISFRVSTLKFFICKNCAAITTKIYIIPLISRNFFPLPTITDTKPRSRGCPQ